MPRDFFENKRDIDRRAKRDKQRRKRVATRKRQQALALVAAALALFFTGRFVLSGMSNDSSAQSSKPETSISLVEKQESEKKTPKKEDVEIDYVTADEAKARRFLPRTEKVQAEGFRDKLDTFLVTNDDTILYNRDSAKSTEVARIPKGTYVETYGHENGWTKISSVGRKGFVPDNKLDVISDASTFVVVDGNVIVNADYSLAGSYETVFREDAAAALRVMMEAMERDGVKVNVANTYRSAADEAKELVLSGNPKNAPEAGHSVFQTGAGVKFYVEGTDPRIDNNFQDTDAFKWLKAHAHEFGYILRYPEGSETITGYRADPTIFVYVGVEDASIIRNEGLTMEVFYGVQ